MYSTLTHTTYPNTDNTAFQTALIEKESNNLVATATININVATTTPKATTATTTTTTFATTVTTTAKITEITQNSDENNPLVHYYANKLKYINVQTKPNPLTWITLYIVIN